MIENLINSIGGYDSWQFTCLAFGLFLIGTLLRMKWVFTIPIPLMGLVLMYFMLNNAYTIGATNISDPKILGIASIIPLLATVIGLFVVIDPSSVGRIFGLTSSNTKPPVASSKEETGGE